MTGPRGLVVVGASAGGVEALRTLVGGLPADLDAAICVVLHIARGGKSALADILDRAGPLPATHATDGEALESGRIFVAPADFHLLVRDGRLHLSRGPAENGHRPAIDPLFRSSARAWGAATVGVVLSGSRDDGAFGLALFELPGQPAPRFRCRVGHLWSAAGLLDEQAEAMEGALWMALRSLEEKAALSRRMAESAQVRGNRTTAGRYADASVEAESASRIIRRLIGQRGNPGDTP